jgi:UDP:flavonoid glycosyltransferase YjiC (YdhE family)
MSRFVIATMPIPGHVAPMACVARALVERGNDVVWYTSAAFRDKVEATGAVHRPIVSTLDYGDGDYDRHFPERTKYRGLRQVVFDFEHIFADAVEGYVKDLGEILAEFDADVLVIDPAVVAGVVLTEVDGIPVATLNVSVLGLPTPGIPPFGLGLPPMGAPSARVANRAAYWLVDNVIFRRVNKAFGRIAARHHWPVHPFRPMATRWLYLQPSVPELEFPNADALPQVHFIGPLLPPAGSFEKPSWWRDLLSAKEAGKKVVLVTQGTIATDPTELILPTLTALSDKDVFVVAAGADPANLPVTPANARVAPFVPFAEVMPLVDAYVTNGGFGGVVIALAHGVPIVTAGTTEDKADVGQRVAHAGVGINLKTNRPAEPKLSSAIAEVLARSTYRARAQFLQQRFAEHDGPTEAAVLLEQLARTRQPVLRGQVDQPSS